MNLLIVGRGKGSWTMRGQQIGAALGARIRTDPTVDDWAWAEAVLVIKREAFRYQWALRQLRVPILWDALDFWRQPADHALAPDRARALLQQMIDQIRPTLVIGATEAMAHDAGGTVIPHHGYLNLTPAPVRHEAHFTIGYDGNTLYLDHWARALTRLCAEQGWTFVVNPADLRAVDLVVALRGGPWDGWICREWKSGVKLTNAVLAGRPVVTQDTAAMRELALVGTIIATEADLRAACLAWADMEIRAAAADTCRARAADFSLPMIAARYQAVLATVAERGVACI